jgi:hypothetical protein
MSRYALGKGDGWSDGLGTHQQETDEYPGSAGEKWRPMGSPAIFCHHEIVAPSHSVNDSRTFPPRNPLSITL